MIARTFDAARLNALANAPDVRPWLGGDGASVVDLTEIVRSTWNIALASDRGAFLCFDWENGWYDVHALFRSGDGVHAVSAMRDAQRFLFTETRAQVLVGTIAPANTRTRWLAAIGGFRHWLTKANGHVMVYLDGNEWRRQEARHG